MRYETRIWSNDENGDWSPVLNGTFWYIVPNELNFVREKKFIGIKTIYIVEVSKSVIFHVPSELRIEIMMRRAIV